MIIHHRNLLPDEAFDAPQKGIISLGYKRIGAPGCACAGGASDPVDVAVSFLREIIIDDQIDAFHIESACRDIGRHERAARILAKLIERTFPCIL